MSPTTRTVLRRLTWGFRHPWLFALLWCTGSYVLLRGAAGLGLPLPDGTALVLLVPPMVYLGPWYLIMIVRHVLGIAPWDLARVRRLHGEW